MRSLLFVLALAACAEENKPSVDNGQNCAQPGPSLEDRCGEELCGNGLLDRCWRENLQAHCPMWGMEACDGDATCSQVGFYGTTVACNNCNLDTSACEACGPDARLCEALDGGRGKLSLATSGSHIALVRGERVTWFDDQLREIATATFGENPTVTAVTGGWLVASQSPSRLAFVDAAGVQQSSVALQDSTRPYLLSAPVNGHVLVVGADSLRVVATIASEQGAIEVQPTEVSTGYIGDADVTTDGTSFWIAVGGALVKVATSGTATKTSIFGPVTLPSMVTWNGNGGVYAVVSASTDPSTSFVHFDAAGVKTGDAVVVHMLVHDIVPDGANVLALTDEKVTLTSIDPTTGTVTVGKELGAGRGNRTLAQLGSDVVVAWDREIGGTRHQIAIAAP